MPLKQIITFLFLSIMISSCATMFNSGSQTMLAKASGNQEGIEVEVTTPSGSYSTKLPATIVAEPSSNDEVTIKVVDKCYDSMEKIVDKSVTPSFWLNTLNVYGGFILDWATGKMWKYDSNIIVPVNKIGC